MVCGDLFQASTSFLHKQFVDVSSSDEFMMLSKVEFIEILEMDELNVTGEEQVGRYRWEMGKVVVVVVMLSTAEFIKILELL